jgi:hypothetical protein
MLRHTIRAGRIVTGLGLIAIGAVLAIPGVPGPGLLVIFVGLTVLSSEFHWANRLRERMHEIMRRIAHKDHKEKE